MLKARLGVAHSRKRKVEIVATLENKVVFITGAGRGQGRNHAVGAAAAGANVALVDLGGAGVIENPSYPSATKDDLLKTKALVEAEGGEALVFECDVRDYPGLREAAEETARHWGGIDCLVANAGIGDNFLPLWDIPNENWQTMIDINLTGVFYTCKAVVPHIRQRGIGGSIILVSSASAGYKALGFFAHYTASKFGVRGLALSLAKELGPEIIRCNSLHPGAVHTPMTGAISQLSGVDEDSFLEQFRSSQLIPEVLEPRDTTAAVVWLLSDDSRYVTGLEMVVDGGETKK